MKSDALNKLAEASKRMLLADLAELARLTADDAALEAASEQEKALARAATSETQGDMAAAAAADKARAAAEARAARHAYQRQMLQPSLEAARQAALSAHGRERAIEILQSRARLDEHMIAERREEAELFGVAAARRAGALKQKR